MLRIIPALALLIPMCAHAQPAPDHVAEAAAATAQDLMYALIRTRADVSSCKLELAKMQAPPPKSDATPPAR